MPTANQVTWRIYRTTELRNNGAHFVVKACCQRTAIVMTEVNLSDQGHSSPYRATKDRDTFRPVTQQLGTTYSNGHANA